MKQKNPPETKKKKKQKKLPTNLPLQKKTKHRPEPPTCYLGEVQDICGQYKDKFIPKLL